MSSSGAEDYKKNIGLAGSVSLLVSAITGPGLIGVPGTFQSSGWLPSLAIFALISVLSSLGALFLTEAISKYPGNAAFQRNVELTTLVQHFYGPTYHLITQLVLYASMQSVNIASIVISTQAIDRFWVHLAGGTCGFELGVSTGGWLCVNHLTASDGTSPFIGNGTPGTMMLFTLGFLALICLVVPLATMDLNDNTVIQFISFLVLLGILGFWFATFLSVPLTTSLVPTIGIDVGPLVGNVLSNYAFVTTVPSWLGVKHPKVSVHTAVLLSLGVALGMYLSIGLIGGMWHKIAADSDLLAEIDNQVINVIFPLFTLVTSIPVNIIIIRANLVQAKVCGRGWAMFWAALFPFLICIPLQTSDSLNTFFSWASLISSSLANFITPYLIYIFLKKRKSDDIIMHLHPEMSNHTLNTNDDGLEGSNGALEDYDLSVEMLEEDAKLMTVKVDLAEITATLKDAATSRTGNKKGITSSKTDSMLGSRFIGSKLSVGGRGRDSRRNSVLATMLPSGHSGNSSLMGNILARAASRNLSDKSGGRRKSFVDLQLAADLGLSQGQIGPSIFDSNFKELLEGGSSVGVGVPSIYVSDAVESVSTAPSTFNPVAPAPQVVAAPVAESRSSFVREDSDSSKSSSSFSRSGALQTILSNSDLESELDDEGMVVKATSKIQDPPTPYASIPAPAPAPAAPAPAPVAAQPAAAPEPTLPPKPISTETFTKSKAALAFQMPRSMKKTVGRTVEQTAEASTASSAPSSQPNEKAKEKEKEPPPPEPLTERDLLPPGVGSLSDLGKPAIMLTLTPFDADAPTEMQIGLDGKVRKTPVVPKVEVVGSVAKESKEVIKPEGNAGKVETNKTGKQRTGATVGIGKGSSKSGPDQQSSPSSSTEQPKDPSTKASTFEGDNPYGTNAAIQSSSKKDKERGSGLAKAAGAGNTSGAKPPLAPAVKPTKKVEGNEAVLPPLPAKNVLVQAAAPVQASQQQQQQPTGYPQGRRGSRGRRASLERERRGSLEQQQQQIQQFQQQQQQQQARRSSLPSAGGERRSSLPRTGEPPLPPGTAGIPHSTSRGDIRAIPRRSSKDGNTMSGGLPSAIVTNGQSDYDDLSFSPHSSSPSSSRQAFSAQSSFPTSATALLPPQMGGLDSFSPTSPTNKPPIHAKPPSVAGFYLDPYYRNRLKELQQANPDYPRPDLDGLDALDQVLPEGIQAFQAIPSKFLVIRMHGWRYYWNAVVGLFTWLACCIRLRRGKKRVEAVGGSAGGLMMMTSSNGWEDVDGDQDDRGQGKLVEIQPHWVALVALIITGCTTLGAILQNIVAATT